MSKSSASKNIVKKLIPFDVNQGVAVDENFYYPISNTRIVKCDKETDKVIVSWEADLNEKEFAHFHHLNSGTVVNGKLYCAHSRYGIDANDNSVEIWNIEEDLLEHERTIRIPREHGSLTWIDKHPDGTWWMCYAVYGQSKNQETKLVKYHYIDSEFVEIKDWFFPKEVILNWENMSCSGGSWGPNGQLYTTGHDHSKAYVLNIDDADSLYHVRTEKDVGFFGQAIAWDRYSEKQILWGIVKNKYITQTYIPQK